MEKGKLQGVTRDLLELLCKYVDEYEISGTPVLEHICFDFDHNVIVATDTKQMLVVHVDFGKQCKGRAFADPEAIKSLAGFHEKGSMLENFKFENNELVCMCIGQDRELHFNLDHYRDITDGSENKVFAKVDEVLSRVRPIRRTAVNGKDILYKIHRKGFMVIVDQVMPIIDFMDATDHVYKFSVRVGDYKKVESLMIECRDRSENLVFEYCVMGYYPEGVLAAKERSPK